MPILRNPFRKSPSDLYHNDDNGVRVTDADVTAAKTKPDLSTIPRQGSFFNSLTSKPVKIPAQGTEKEPAEYQLCEINDSGVFMPPSPLERQSFWSSSRSAASRTSSYRSVSVWDENNEPFNMSRASFDSYRRSFDISARSPVTTFEPATSPKPRQSLDLRQVRYSFSATNATSPSMPRLSPPRLPDMSQAPLRDNYFNPPTSLEEDVAGESEASDAVAKQASRFEDVGLNDDKKPTKKRGFFSSHFGNSSHSESAATQVDSNNNNNNSSNGSGPSPAVTGHSHSHTIGSIFNRKRGASGQGAELGRIRNQENQQPAPTVTSSITAATAASATSAANDASSPAPVVAGTRSDKLPTPTPAPAPASATVPEVKQQQPTA